MGVVRSDCSAGADFEEHSVRLRTDGVRHHIHPLPGKSAIRLSVADYMLYSELILGLRVDHWLRLLPTGESRGTSKPRSHEPNRLGGPTRVHPQRERLASHGRPGRDLHLHRD